WVAEARRRGDHRGAIEAAWPARTLRETIGDDLAGLRALGGDAASAGLALELAWRPDARRTTEALTAIDAGDVALLETLADHRAADPVADRRLAGAGVRALLRTGTARQVHNRLRERADPLLRADLPAFVAAAKPDGVPQLDAPRDPGALDLRDALA